MSNICKIMIVDDEFIMRQGIKFMLKWEENGYKVVGEASNGKEALELIPELEPHIILCDIAMPIMNGLDFIKLVTNEYPNIKIVVLSGYDNFDYVRNSLTSGAVDYVLKPTLTPEELLKILERVVKTIPDLDIKPNKINLLEKYLLEQNGEKPNFEYNCFRLFVLSLDNTDRNNINLRSVLYEKTIAFLNDIKSNNMNFIYNNHRLCIVLNYPVEKDNEILSKISSFVQNLSEISENIFAVISKCDSNLEQMRAVFKSPRFLNYESFYFKNCNLYLAEDIKSDIKLDKFDYRKFSNLVNDRKFSDAGKMIYEYILNAVDYQMSSIKLKNQTKNFIYNLIGENDNNEIEEIYINGFDKIENANYADDFIQIVKDILNALEAILSKDEQPTDEYMEMILNYIKENYKEDLNLQILSDKFNFGYSYLSAYFAQYAHEGFSEYLNKIRISKACEILKQSKYSISEVSSAVGYSDHSYFCRVFKKITGVTPSVYRKAK